MNDQENEVITTEEETSTYVAESSESVAESMLNAMNDFYHQYVVESVNGTFQIFKSFTYGEMVIATLLTCILFLMVIRFVYEVIR